jgi:hypothetical protein
MNSMQRKLAAVLNFAVWGAGYLYQRERTAMGAILLAGYLPIHWYWISEVGVIPALSGSSILVFVGHLLLSTGFAYDVYNNHTKQ